VSEPERDRWGRYKLTDPTNPEAEIRPWTRATTIAGTLDDKFGLHAWEIRQVIIGLVKSPDLLDLAYASDPEDKQQLEEIAENAKKFAGGDVNSNRGTALHRFTQRLDAGSLSRSPRQWQEHLDAYMAFKEAEGIQTHPSFIERITVVPELETAGTMDRIVKHEGEAKIGDVKTGSLGYDGMKIAIQLAIYAHGAGLWDEKTGKWLPMPKVSQTEGLVFHLPQSRDEGGNLIPPQLYRVDIDTGWKLAKAAYWIRELRKSKALLKGNVPDVT
jgi:hypothetical protein